MTEFRVEMRVLEISEAEETETYRRDNKRVLAEFDVPASPGRALSTFQQALTELCRPDVLLTSKRLSDEEADEIRRKFTQTIS